MKLNKKGFTLIELLVTIVIICLVVGFSTYGIIQILKNTEEQKVTLSESSIKEAARIYSGETDSSLWKDDNDYESFCVTIGELMNKGLLDKDASLVDNVTRDNFVIVKRNKITLAVDKEIITTLDSNDNNYNFCINQSITDNEVITRPKINDWSSYTDGIEISFEEGTASYNGIESNVTYNCLYGNSSSNMTKEGVIEDNKCILEGLKNNSTYYAVVYMHTDNGSTVASEGNKEYFTTDFKDTTITPDSNVVTIKYNDTDDNGNPINSASYVFKSTVDGISNVNLKECVLNNYKFTCNDYNTNSITKNTWYKTDSTVVEIEYPEESNTINISARIYDGSNNYREDSQNIIINKYTIRFYINNASTIGGSSSEYIEKYCIASSTESCNIISPTIESRAGYTAVGWNTDSGATTSTWNANITKNVNSNESYYAITRINKVYIRYSVNGGTITSRTTENGITSNWTVKDEIIYKNNQLYYQSINYGGQTSNDGLANYNNSNYINITKTGYVGVTGQEWKCMSGCTEIGKTYGQTIQYNDSDFCDISNGDCTVIMGVNWIEKFEYTITYKANGGDKNTIPDIQIEEQGVNTSLSSIIPIRTDYIFKSWNTNADGSGITYKPGEKYSGNTDIVLYAQWEKHTIHTFDAIGVIKFEIGEESKFTCNYYHTNGYAIYCSKCGMSVRYYNIKNGTSDAQLWCPCDGAATRKIIFDDSSFEKNANQWKRLGNQCGLTCGEPLLDTDPTVTSDCSEHIPGNLISNRQEINL